MPVHYAPRTRAIRVEARELAGFDWPSRSALFLFGQRELVPLPEVNYLYVSDTPETASRDFYAALHACDERGLDLIVIVPPPNLPAWEAIRDRIHKATRPWSEA